MAFIPEALQPIKDEILAVCRLHSHPLHGFCLYNREVNHTGRAPLQHSFFSLNLSSSISRYIESTSSPVPAMASHLRYPDLRVCLPALAKLTAKSVFKCRRCSSPSADARWVQKLCRCVQQHGGDMLAKQPNCPLPTTAKESYGAGARALSSTFDICSAIQEFF